MFSDDENKTNLPSIEILDWFSVFFFGKLLENYFIYYFTFFSIIERETFY